MNFVRMLKTFSLYFCGMMILLIMGIAAHNAWDMLFMMFMNNVVVTASLSGIVAIMVELVNCFWDKL